MESVHESHGVTAAELTGSDDINGGCSNGTDMNVSNGSAAIARNRVTAKEQVLQAWQQRRAAGGGAQSTKKSLQKTAAPVALANKQPPQQPPKAKQPKPAKHAALKQQQQQQQQVPAMTAAPPPTVCFILQKAWKDLFFGPPASRPRPSKQTHGESSSSRNRSKSPVPSSGSSSSLPNQATIIRHYSKGSTTMFPSVLDILQANELYKQVASVNAQLQQQQPEPAATATTTDTSVIQSQVLSVLPASYDWNRAVVEMTQSRARAFLLVDLAAIVRMTVTWKRRLYKNKNGGSSHSQKKKIRFLYSICNNADAPLLQVIAQSGVVGWTTTTKWDIARAASIRTVHPTTSPHTATASAAATMAGTSFTTTTAAAAAAHEILYDNCAVTGKPDGYIREWIAYHQQHYQQQQQQQQQGTTTTASSSTTNTPPMMCSLAVDGPLEVERLQRSIQRIAARQQHCDNNSNNNRMVVHYMLRLTGEQDTWSSCVKATVQQLLEHNEQNNNNNMPSQLVGLSLDMSSSLQSTAATTIPERQQAAERLLNQLAAQREQGAATVIASRLRVDLTGSMELYPFDENQLSWWNVLVDRPDVSAVTIDATHALVAPTGALCTRIIGVKEMIQNQQPPASVNDAVGTAAELVEASTKTSLDKPEVETASVETEMVSVASTSSLVDHTNKEFSSLTTTTDNNKEAEMRSVASSVSLADSENNNKMVDMTTATGSRIRRHYYIDDGCYGSLYQSGAENALCPLPLFSSNRTKNDSNGEEDSTTASTPAVYLSTVWGPTCDGLDRVCRDIPLPKLQRDDWLVFPNVGCGNNEGLGTAFNGFDPPDTAYCVLGYFRDPVIG